MSRVRKALVAVAGVLAVAAQVLSDGSVDGTEAGLLATAVITAIGVYLAPNRSV